VRAAAGVVLPAALAVALLLPALADARPWAWMGVRIRDLSEQEMEEISRRHGIREGFGVVVVEVLEDTPAARAGLRSGDLVVALEGRPVTETRLLQRLIAASATDRDTRLTILRPEGRRDIPVRLVSMPRDVVGDRVAAEFGFVLRDGRPPGEAGGGPPASGVPSVGAVLPGSPAERAGLQVGDVVLEVGGRDAPTREAAREALAVVPLDRALQVVVRRQGERVALTLAPP
jgi:S1-C subfamily serine protease